MKKKVGKQPEGFGGLELQGTMRHRDYTRMNARQLLRAGRQMYAGLQALWRVELELPIPDWQVLESVSRQMKILEQGCPEVCEP